MQLMTKDSWPTSTLPVFQMMKSSPRKRKEVVTSTISLVPSIQKMEPMESPVHTVTVHHAGKWFSQNK